MQHTQKKSSENQHLNNYLRIGDDYYEILWKPDKNGIPKKMLDKRKKGTIIDDYGRKVLDQINKYKSFCLVPSHTNYQQTIGEYYNRYVGLDYQPQKGDCPKSLEMVKHIFGDKYELGLDYLKLLYEQPNQLLPVLALVSEERNTGKSTFGQWLIEIFGQNAIKLGNADLANDFNASYAEKSLIVVDETSIEKKIVSEAVKRMSTEQGKILVNAKGIAQYEVDWIGKFVFISNNETNFIHIGKGENRYLVLKVPTLANDNPNFKQNLIKEIPAFLQYLIDRPLKYPKKTRIWFDYELLETEALRRAIEANRNPIEKAIYELVIYTFERFTHLLEFRISYGDLFETVKRLTKYASESAKVRRVLKDDMKNICTHLKSERFQYYNVYAAQSAYDYTPEDRNNSSYLFKVQDFLTLEEMGERADIFK